MSRYKTTEEFIVKAKAVHGDRYEYSRVVYTGCRYKVIIICKDHGEFPQLPNNHLRGQGCPECNRLSITKTKDSFVSEAFGVHGDRYDYSAVVYTNTSTKVSILCREHGVFEQAPSSHIYQRAGCPVCARTKKLTLEDFVRRSREIHQEKYDYSRVIYKSMHSKVRIVCPIHGEFLQKPDNHLSGKGCSKCANYGFNSSKESTFYVYTFGNYAGFGITCDFKTRDSVHRRTFKKKGIKANLVVTHDMYGEYALNLETHLKRTMDIVDCDMSCFKTEAVHLSDLNALLFEIDTFQKEILDIQEPTAYNRL